MGEYVLMALLRHLPSGRLLLAACTHLWWDPKLPDMKLAQAHLQVGKQARGHVLGACHAVGCWEWVSSAWPAARHSCRYLCELAGGVDEEEAGCVVARGPHPAAPNKACICPLTICPRTVSYTFQMSSCEPLTHTGAPASEPCPPPPTHPPVPAVPGGGEVPGPPRAWL
jgi:hypothetical protein